MTFRILRAALLATLLSHPANAQTAEDYLAAGDPVGARAALAAMVRGRPDAALHMAQLEGLILLRQGRAAEAAEAFRAILAAEPRYIPARRGLTEALAVSGDIGAAAWHAERLLAATADERERQALESLVARAQAGKAQGVALRFALLPSTNATRGTGAETVMVGGLPFVVDDASREQGGVGLSFGFSAWRARPMGPSWTATLGASADARLYESGIDDEATVALRLEIARGASRSRLSFGPLAEMRFREGSEDRRRLGLGATYARRIGTRHELSLAATLWRQWYPEAEFRNGTLAEGRLGWRAALGPATALSLTLPFEVERTDRPHLDHAEIGIGLGIEREWRGGLVTLLSAGWRQDDYDGLYPGFARARRDEIRTLGVGLRHRGIRVGRFVPEVTYTFTDARSNIPFHDYQAHDIGLSLSTRF